MDVKQPDRTQGRGLDRKTLLALSLKELFIFRKI